MKSLRRKVRAATVRDGVGRRARRGRHRDRGRRRVCKTRLQNGAAFSAAQSQIGVRGGRSAPPVPSDPLPTFHEHMFPTLTTRRPRNRSLRERVREAVGTALEFATLGEATLGPAAPQAPVPQPAPAPSARSTAPTFAHPHRRRLDRQQHARRSGIGPPPRTGLHLAGQPTGAGADLNRTAPRSGRTGAPDGLPTPLGPPQDRAARVLSGAAELVSRAGTSTATA